MTFSDLQNNFRSSLEGKYNPRELDQLFWICIDSVSNWSRLDFQMHSVKTIERYEQDKYERVIEELLNGKPIQYILNEVDFYGQQYYVDENVLIPRPETEELVDWIVQDYSNAHKNLIYLDIGTGSGCIINSLAKNLTGIFHASDKSEMALKVAGKNAKRTDVTVQFIKDDILNTQLINQKFDVIVSNPPYIPEKEKEIMEANVLKYEPHLALFVNDNDVLVFYKAIIRFASKSLNKNGCLFFEIHESYSSKLKALVQSINCSFEFKKDLQGKTRMLKIWDIT